MREQGVGLLLEAPIHNVLLCYDLAPKEHIK